MRLTLHRWPSLKESTLGGMLVDGSLFCFTLEDEQRSVKVTGETRIPAGTYQIKLRAEGGMHAKYAAKYPEHRGMLWLQDVPGFEWVYIHIGNDDDDTEGCLLVGDGAHVSGKLSESVPAYQRLYRKVLASMDAGETVTIEVRD